MINLPYLYFQIWWCGSRDVLSPDHDGKIKSETIILIGRIGDIMKGWWPTWLTPHARQARVTILTTDARELSQLTRVN